MLYSDSTPTESVSISARDNSEFFARVAGEIGPDEPSVLLIGGADFASWTARSQQALMRFDRRPSDYSHAALVCAWDPNAPGESWGLELDPIGVPASMQRPEHAGVTAFRLHDYLDTEAFPNLAVIHVPLGSPERARALIDAARTPVRDALRYPLLRWLAAWRAFVTQPEGLGHPLLTRTPHPGAAFVAMAYEAAEISLIPGATDMQHCPELLWANAKHWGPAVGAEVRVFRVLRDEHAAASRPQPVPIEIPGTVHSEGSART